MSTVPNYAAILGPCSFDLVRMGTDGFRGNMLTFVMSV